MVRATRSRSLGSFEAASSNRIGGHRLAAYWTMSRRILYSKIRTLYSMGSQSQELMIRWIGAALTWCLHRQKSIISTMFSIPPNAFLFVFSF